MHWEQSDVKGAIVIVWARGFDGGKAIDPLPDRVVDTTHHLN